MADSPQGKRPNRPEIWASGGQRPPFDLRALGQATLLLSRQLVAPLHAWAARRTRHTAINVKNGAGRIPAEKLGRAERFVPSHLRVAAWIQNLAATLSHASATADIDVKRGNALVAEIEPHLWAEPPPLAEPAPAPEGVAPVVLPEPKILQPDDDPLASIRDEIAPPGPVQKPRLSADNPPAPPGQMATAVIQVGGYLLGWASVGLALPYGLARSLWLWIGGRDLKGIGRED
jgi:hypothetical protein